MAEKIVSPVFTRENDLSFLFKVLVKSDAQLLDPFIKDLFVPTVVNTQSEFEEIFGTPDGTYYTAYTVQNYLEKGTVTIVRVGDQGGYYHERPFGIKVTGSVVKRF